MFGLPAHTLPISLFSSTTSWFPSGNGLPLNFRKILPFSHCPQASHILLFCSSFFLHLHLLLLLLLLLLFLLLFLVLPLLILLQAVTPKK